jgi:two-component system sensor histidine kinase HydH
MDVDMRKVKQTFWLGTPPWIILGAILVLSPIFAFWTFQNIHKQNEAMTRLLLEKGAALIRSFEAGTRTGMMGMMGMRGGSFKLQELLTETAQQPDIAYLIVTDREGTVLAHNDPTKIGGKHGQDLALEEVSLSEKLHGRKITGKEGLGIFEVFRRFSPTQMRHKRPRGMMGPNLMGLLPMDQGNVDPESRLIIFVGLGMDEVEAAAKEDMQHSVMMAIVLLLIGFAGIFSLFLVQAYRTTRSSLTRIKAFSDNVVENMPIGLVALDAHGDIVAFNQTAEAVLGRAAGQVLGKKAADILPGPCHALLSDIEKTHKTLEKELDCPLENGKAIPLDLSLSILNDADGTFLGHIILFRDMTEVQSLKREIERSRRLASLGQLAAGVAHEIRNPLSSIKGFATYFKERYKEVPEDLKTAEIMIQEVERLNRVIGQLLEFARPMEAAKKPSSIRILIQHSLKMIERQAREKNIQIKTEFSDDIGDVLLDPDRMNQVLLNLYLNAMEAMEKGGILSVDVMVHHDSKRVIITVRDTGHGISKKDLVHVFDPYFTTKQSGTGLGLAIVHKIIESHGGEVRVTSEPGRGTEVVIFLPHEGLEL